MASHDDAGGALPLPGTPVRPRHNAASRPPHVMGDYDTKAVDRRGPSMASQLPGDQFAGAGMGDPGDSKQAPSGLDPKETLVSSGLEHSTETYTRLTAALRHNSDYTLAFSMIGVMCMMVQNELAWVWNTEAGYGPFCPSDAPDCSDAVKRARAAMFPITDGLVVINAIRAVVSFTTLLALVFCYKFYATQLVVMKSRNLLPQTATLLGSGLRWPFIFELLCLAVHVFPGIDDISDDPSLYLWMNLFMFGRLFLMLRVVRYHSPLLSSNGRFIGALTNVEFDSSFILKTALKHNPVWFMTVCLVTLFVSAGYSIRLIDSLMCVARVELNCAPKSFWDAQWLLAVTILTVGYGDLVPHSDGARFVALVGGLTGTMITAVTIALTTSYLNLSRSESRVVTFLRKDALKRMLQLAAARALQAFYRYYSVSSARTGKKQRAERHMYAALARFREARRYVLSHDPVSPQDRQISLLETMEVNVDDMKAHLELLGGYLIGVPDMVPGLVTEPPTGSPTRVPTMNTASQQQLLAAGNGGAAPGSRSRTNSDATPSAGKPAPPAQEAGGGSAAASVAGDGTGQQQSARSQSVTAPSVASSSMRRRKTNRDAYVSNGDWVSDIRESMTQLTTRLSDLAQDMEDLQNAVARNTKITHTRLDALESVVRRIAVRSQGGGATAGAASASPTVTHVATPPRQPPPN